MSRALLVGASLLVLAAGCTGGSPTPSAPSAAASGPSSSSTTVAVPPTTAATTTTTADPGVLPQTHVLPAAATAAFSARVQGLWQAIVSGDVQPAMPFFFPLSAYVQVKGIANPQADWQNRLVGYYGLDIQAAHGLLGPDAGGASLVGVTVPTVRATWVLPGQEYNKGSYYRVYGTRLAYKIGGRTRSLGIFSLISWRGEWYVVHLGPASRSTHQGIVYQPS